LQRDGSAFVVLDRRLLLPGDYLSAVCHPVLLGSLEAAAASNERLLKAIDEHQIALIVPGHGPALTPDDARQIARADLEYIRSLQAAAADAVRQRVSANAALLKALGVQPPRRARPDFEAFDLLSANARTALSEAGHEAFVSSNDRPE
jgi:glyoxylase-like metal-dependent hydrolase (beta-lactamase superfamily II)